MEAPRVLLFPTCLVQTFLPGVKDAARKVLAHLGAEVHEDPALTCCGQPMYNAGMWEEARVAARPFLERLAAWEGDVVFLAGSCTAMVRLEYPLLFHDTPWEEAAREVAGRVYEFSQYLVERLGVTRVPGHFPYTLAYHPSCHMLRGLKVDREPRLLLDGLEGAERVPWPEEEVCCGFGGVFSGAIPQLAEAMGRDKAQALKQTPAQLGVTCDPGCLLHIQGSMDPGGPPMWHLAEALAWALDHRPATDD